MLLIRGLGLGLFLLGGNFCIAVIEDRGDTVTGNLRDIVGDLLSERTLFDSKETEESLFLEGPRELSEELEEEVKLN